MQVDNSYLYECVLNCLAFSFMKLVIVQHIIAKHIQNNPIASKLTIFLDKMKYLPCTATINVIFIYDSCLLLIEAVAF